MNSFVFGAVLAAAAMHAGWNAFLKVRLEPFLAMALITTMSSLVALPFLIVFGWPKAEAWPWLATSIGLHLCYYLALSEAYRRADLVQIYPIARGGAPLLTALLLLLVEPISVQALGGVMLLGSGVALMSLGPGRLHEPIDPVAIGFAFATACIICGYTLTDGIGARTAGDPHAYSAALFVVNGIPLALFALWLRGMDGIRAMASFAAHGLAGGTLSLGSYWIAIWAMTVAPIALVAALRETSVLFATGIAIVLLKEPFGPIRAVAASLIVGGLVMIRLQ